MSRQLTRSRFLATAAAGGSTAALAAASAGGQTSGPAQAGSQPLPAPKVAVCNPLLRTPLSLIIDDSCPVINMGYYWIKQRHDWRMRLHPESPPSGWEKHYDKL